MDGVRLLQAHKAEVFVVAWSPTTVGQLVSGSRDAVVNYWIIPFTLCEGPSSRFQVLQPTLTLPSHSASPEADLTSVDWNPDGSLVAIGSYNAVLRVLTSVGKGPIFAAKFSPSGQWIATASLDGTTRVWDVENKRIYCQYRNHEGACCLDIEWIDDSTIATGGSDKAVHIVSLNGTKPIHTFSATHHAHAEEGHPGNPQPLRQVLAKAHRVQRLATSADDTIARIWNIEHLHSEKLISNDIVLKGYTRCVTVIKWCPNAQAREHEMVATASFDYTARLWDAVTGDCLKEFTDHTKYVFALSFSPDGTLLATGGGDSSLYVYDVKTRERNWSWTCPKKTAVFEMDWMQWGGQSLIALAMEHRVVGTVDPSKFKKQYPGLLAG